MSNIFKTQFALTDRFIKHEEWFELLPPTDEKGWVYVSPNPLGGFIWKREVDTGKKFTCILCSNDANDNSNYCSNHQVIRKNHNKDG